MDPIQSELNGPRRHLDGGRGAPPIGARLGDGVEEGEETVELGLGDGVVLVIVTTRAADREPHPGGRNGVDAIDGVLDPELVGDGSAFAVDAVVSKEAGGQLLLRTRLREQIPGQLLDRELVEGQILVQRVNDPFAPPPHGSRLVVLIAVGVGVSGQIEPDRRHAFPIPGRSQEPVDDPLVRAGRRVGEEGVQFIQGRRQPGQVQGHSAQDPALFRGRRRIQSFGFQAVEDEAIQILPGPGGVLDLRQFRPPRRDERPMLLPDGSLLDPTADEIDLVVAQPLLRVRGRHAMVRVFMCDAPKDQAVVRISGNDGHSGGPSLEDVFSQIEPQVCHPDLGIGTVALKTGIGQQRPNLPLKVDSGILRGDRCDQRRQEEIQQHKPDDRRPRRITNSSPGRAEIPRTFSHCRCWSLF